MALRDSIILEFLDELFHRSVLLTTDPPPIYLSMLLSPLCFVLPYVMAANGYGSTLRYTWILLLPILAGAFLFLLLSLLLFKDAVKKLINIVRKRTEVKGKVYFRFLKWFCPVIYCTLMFLVGWRAGVIFREHRCLETGTSLAGLIERLDLTYMKYKKYPKPGGLSRWGELREIRKKFRVHIVDMSKFERKDDLSGLTDMDAVIYLGPHSYEIFIPIEYRNMMSFTRFYVFRRSAGKDVWEKDHVIWFYGCFN